LSIAASRPIPSRVTMAVQRALRYAALRAKPNAEKRLALMYYNYPVGKANIGASYLNVAESLANILARLEEEGYDVGSGDISPDGLLAEMTEKAHNVGSYAPGELEALLAAGDAVRPSHNTGSGSTGSRPFCATRSWRTGVRPRLPSS
jgi:cobaltochelatase CobN